MLSKPPEKKDPLLLDHDYDGIQELDNPLPRWWLWLFYISIVFAFGYVTFYWVGPGLSIQEKFEIDMAKDAPKNDSENTFDLSTWKPSKLDSDAGKKAYLSKCAPCHGQLGEGLIGPNLTDQYWIHGDGKIEGIYAVIRDGVPEKGMISWKDLLSPKEIAEISHYITTLKGSTPSNAKAPEGSKYN